MVSTANTNAQCPSVQIFTPECSTLAHRPTLSCYQEQSGNDMMYNDTLLDSGGYVMSNYKLEQSENDVRDDNVPQQTNMNNNDMQDNVDDLMGSAVLGTTDDLSGKTKLVHNYLGHDMVDPDNDHMSTDILDSCDNLIVSKTARSKGNITDNTAIPSGYDHRVNNDHGPAVLSNIHEKEQS